MQQRKILILSIPVLLLSGCGQMGPLYLPSNPPPDGYHQLPLPHPGNADFSGAPAKAKAAADFKTPK